MGSFLPCKRNISKNKMRNKKFKNSTRQYAFEKKSQHKRESKIFSTSKEAKQVSFFVVVKPCDVCNTSS